MAPTGFALVAFAANSVLCRSALGGGLADPAGFTALRIASGAAVLGLLVAARGARRTGGDGARRGPGAWGGAAALFVYAAAFSFAYTALTAGTGALLLFVSVQATMVLAGLRAGERAGRAEVAGFALALGGLAWLLAPGFAAPAPGPALLMVVAGVAWGGYSLLGRRSADPAGDTAFAFAAALVPAVLLLAAPRSVGVTPRGVGLAILSGAVASGLGYVAWAAALPRLTALRAALVQLAVPALTACAGAALLGEPVTARLVASSALILGGVGLAAAVHARR